MSTTTATSISVFDEAYDYSLQQMQLKSPAKPQGLMRATGEVGFSNCGQSCFCNSVLQSLLNTPKFASLYIGRALRDFINENNPNGSGGAMTGCLSALADFLWSGDAKWVSTRVFLDTFAIEVNRQFTGAEQEDAHEFQTLLLNKLAEDVQKITNPRPFQQDFQTRELDATKLQQFAEKFHTLQQNFNSSPVNDIFKLTTTTLITCSKCGNVMVNFEEQNHLSVDINFDTTPAEETPAPISLNQCFANHFGAGILETRCPNCDVQGPRRLSSTSFWLWTLPSMLIVHLKRFGFEEGKAVKNCRHVAFPMVNLDLKDYMHPDQQGVEQERTKYTLYAVVAHRGKDANYGHYVALVKNLDRAVECWNLFSDKKRTPIEASDVQAEHDYAYMLYYARDGLRKSTRIQPAAAVPEARTTTKTITTTAPKLQEFHLAHPMPMERLVFQINGDEPHMAGIKLKIKNPTDQHRLFKVRCANELAFKVRPPVGVIKPGEDTTVELRLADEKKLPENGTQCHYSIYTSETSDEVTSARKQWETRQPHCLKRLLVVFENHKPLESDAK